MRNQDYGSPMMLGPRRHVELRYSWLRDSGSVVYDKRQPSLLQYWMAVIALAKYWKQKLLSGTDHLWRWSLSFLDGRSLDSESCSLRPDQMNQAILVRLEREDKAHGGHSWSNCIRIKFIINKYSSLLSLYIPFHLIIFEFSREEQQQACATKPAQSLEGIFQDLGMEKLVWAKHYSKNQ